MPIYLIRHAHAGARSKWPGDDAARPLDGKGRRQVEHIMALLADEPIGAVYSSPATRCVQTVTPLAAARGHEVLEIGELFEGGDADEALRFACRHAPESPALCSHGDVIPKMLRRLSAAGMRSLDGNVAHKGSVWVLDVDDETGAVISGTYHPPA